MLAQIFGDNVEKEKVMDVLYMVIGILCLFMGGLFYSVFIAEPKRRKKEEQKKQEEQERENRRDEEQEKEYERKEIEVHIPNTFSVKLGNTLEDKNKAYDEIVRLVNLEAVRTAKVCVKQDKKNRGDDGGYDEHFDSDVADLKLSWAKMRNNALKLNPKLRDRMPHFSEFEPLKSYNEEHLLKKKAKSKQ